MTVPLRNSGSALTLSKSAPTLGATVARIEKRLRRARLHFGHGTDNARDEAAWLVLHAAGLPVHGTGIDPAKKLSAAALGRIEDLARARIRRRKPLAYLIHEAWFAGLPFYVDERVLIPRSLIGEWIPYRFRPWVNPAQVRRILEIGTGSGCIAIALARAFPKAKVIATDISEDALAVARINVKRYRLGSRVELRKGSLYEPVAGECFDMIVSNPPYVSTHRIKRLPAEYRHEPHGALHARDAGLAVVQPLLLHAADHLTANGVVIIETGAARWPLQRRYPSLPLHWLTSVSGEECVLLISRAELNLFVPA